MKRKIKVYGERNTGTNFLNKLLNLNFDIFLVKGTVPKELNYIIKIFPFKEYLRDKYFELFKGNLGWKHREIDNVSLLKKSNNIYYITISKNPYSYLLSFYKRPYHNERLINLPFREFINKTIYAVGRENEGHNYENVIDLWNKKNESYINLSKNISNVINIRYEDLLIAPNEVFFEISKKFNLNFKENEFVNFYESTKELGKDNNYYKDYYGKELWKSKLSKPDIEFINSKLDRNVVEFFNYELL